MDKRRRAVRCVLAAAWGAMGTEGCAVNTVTYDEKNSGPARLTRKWRLR